MKDEDTQFVNLDSTEHMFFRKEWFKNIKIYIENIYIVCVDEGNILLKVTLILINIDIDGIYACYIISGVLYIIKEEYVD